MSDIRTLPHSLEAERSVLGGLLIDASRLGEIIEIVAADDFYRESHGKLFTLLIDMSERGEPLELTSVVERAFAGGKIDELGGVTYLTSLADQVPSTENLAFYARVVRERALQRKLIVGAREIAEAAHTKGDDIDGLIDFAEKTVFDVTQQSQNQDWAQLSTVLDEEFVKIQERSETRSDLTGIDTGYRALNQRLAGFQRKDLLILAARPSMGKTALALNFALHAANRGVGVGVVSLEMGKEQLVTRLLTSEARVDAGKVRTGHLSRDQDWPRLADAAERLHGLPLFIDDMPGLSITQIRSRARRLKSQHPHLGLLVVDYIGLINGDPRISREQQVATSSRGLKALAKELDCSVVALSQLNRGVEQRPNKRPVLSDLRESGAIEQDADVIMFIYRDEYYNRENCPEPGVAEIIIAKQRNGPTGTVKLFFEGQFTRFNDLDERHAGAGDYL